VFHDIEILARVHSMQEEESYVRVQWPLRRVPAPDRRIEGRLKQIDKEMKRIQDASYNPPAAKFLSGREKARELLADLRQPAHEE
jgi:hypothetical protein